MGPVALRLGAAMAVTYPVRPPEVKAAPELRCFRFLYRARGSCRRQKGWDLEWGDVMDPKRAMLIMLFGSIIGLSYLSGDTLARFKRWRKTAP
jgi:hypothetical protein